MNKRKFLAPLAVSVAALLSGAALPTRTSTVPVSIAVAPAHGASVAVAADQLDPIIDHLETEDAE